MGIEIIHELFTDLSYYGTFTLQDTVFSIRPIRGVNPSDPLAR